MENNLDLLIVGAQVVAPHPQSGELKLEHADVGIHEGRIVAVASKIPTRAENTIRAEGLVLLPGAIDTQVHFREPGYPEKEDLKSGSRAAVFGGVTGFFDMPNTNPPTLSAIDLNDKLSRAKNQTWCHYAFYLGASPVNAARLPEIENLPGVCGIKMFMGSSTGNLLVGSDDVISMVLKNGQRRVAVHAEDENRLIERKKIVLEQPGQVALHPVWRDAETAVLATSKVLKMARTLNRKVHILHVSTAQEIEILKGYRDIATVEVTPQHLTLSAPECYERLGTFAQMNPPIRTLEHQEALWRGVLNGTVDILGSDHAPHTRSEKLRKYPDTPSGMTGVQTMLPLMLHHFNEKRIGLTRIVELLAQNPSQIFGIKNKGQIRVGYDADLTLVDLNKTWEIRNSWIQSTCGWTPFDGMKCKGKVMATLVSGQVAMRDDQLLGKPRGQALEFQI